MPRSGAHDPDLHRDPERFDLRRETVADHLSLSGGPPFAVVAPLVRTSAAAVLRVLAARLPAVRRAGPVVLGSGPGHPGHRAVSRRPLRCAPTRRANPLWKVLHHGVLITSLAVEAHFNGAVPLAWALRAAGHEVRVASHPALTESITRAGLTAVPVGTDHVHHELVRDLGAELDTFYRDIDFTGERGDDYVALKGANTLLTATFYAQANNDSMVDELSTTPGTGSGSGDLGAVHLRGRGGRAEPAGAAHARLLWARICSCGCGRRFGSGWSSCRRSRTTTRWRSG